MVDMFFKTQRRVFPTPKAQYWDSSEKLEEAHQILRKFHLEDVPLSSLDVSEVFEIDPFYLDCQRYRYQYSDPYVKVHCPKFFPPLMRKSEIKVDRSLSLMTQSIAANMDHQPVVFPLIRDCGMVLSKSFPMIPMNYKSCDTSYPQRIFVKCVPVYVIEIIVIGIYAALNIICT